jgi:hypothetical protein
VHRSKAAILRVSEVAFLPFQTGACGSQYGTYGIFRRGFPAYSGLAPENLTTFAHFSVSSTMNLPKSEGEPANVVPPRSANRVSLPKTRFAHIDGGGRQGSDVQQHPPSLVYLSIVRRLHYVWRLDDPLATAGRYEETENCRVHTHYRWKRAGC